jgi:myo-inositol-1(or 4)-monophosphatase
MISPLINVMSAAVLKAGKGLLRDFGEVDQLQVSRKGTANFVTHSDIRTEKLLQAELKKARPAYGFLLEEGGEVKGKDEQHRWIIDPLDGTTNFIHAIPYFCISVGLEKRDAQGNSEIIAGVIFDPIQNDLFSAEKGKGAELNGRRLAVSKRDTLVEAMVVTGSLRSHAKGDPKAYALFDAISQSGAIMRDFGASALDMAYLAAGRIDVCRLNMIQPWDVAAGMLLIHEAGGMVTQPDGSPADVYCTQLLATNGHLHSPLQKLMLKAA